MTTRWDEIKHIWKENRWLYTMAGILLGILITPALQLVTGDLNGLLGNLVPEAIGIIFTVLILDRLAENREREALKTRLFNEMRSSAVGQGTAALAWLRREGWVAETTLIGADLHRANWENAYIGQMNLDRANLNAALLKNITNQITDESGKTEAVWVSLNHTALRHAQLENAVLIGASIKGTNLRKANLRNAVLIDVDLTCADCTRADFQGVRFYRASLLGANLLGARLDHIKWMDHEADVPPILPDGERWSPTADLAKYTDANHPLFAETCAKINTIRFEKGYEALKAG